MTIAIHAEYVLIYNAMLYVNKFVLLCTAATLHLWGMA
jgi:hypothetical protein